MDRLINAYTNEKSTNALSKFDSIVEYYNSALQEIKPDIHELEINSILKQLQELEAERIKYFVKEYILCRFDKIRRNMHIDVAMLSEKERIFYENYIQSLKEKDIYCNNTSNVFEFVGFIANKNIEAIKIDKEIIKILKGEFFVANLNDIREYLEHDDVSLC